MDAILKTISETLAKSEKINLVGFGSFSVVERSARTGINPATKESISIEAKKVVKFKAGSELANTIQ